jgi:hypothetical protein
MKLASVTFLSPVPYNGQASADYSSQAVALSYDKASDSVRIGNDGLEVPRSRVAHWKRDRAKEPPDSKVQCDLCSRQFNNRQALGGHKRHAHGVASTRVA